MSTLTPEQLKATIFDVLGRIAPELDTETLRPDAPLREQVDLDSFDFLNVLIVLNERLHVEVPEKDYAQLQTLDSMLHYFGARCCEVPRPSATDTRA